MKVYLSALSHFLREKASINHKNMSLLIHACCADCLLKLLDSLKTEPNFTAANTKIIFYNPNIYPREEYQARLKAVKKIATEQGIKLIVPNYKPQEYFAAVGGISGEDEGYGEANDGISRVNIPSSKVRCPKCWFLRLSKLFMCAQAENCNSVTSTLLSSSYQDQEKIKSIALELSKKYKIDFYLPKNICCHLKTSGFYKQNFCGCLFSLIEKSREKYGV